MIATLAYTALTLPSGEPKVAELYGLHCNTPCTLDIPGVRSTGHDITRDDKDWGGVSVQQGRLHGAQ